MKSVNPAALATMPTLVIGGAGFIGSRVVEALLARGAEVRVLDDLSTGRPTELPLHDPNLELRIGDMHEPDVVGSAMEGMKSCVHLAAAPAPRARLQDPHQAALSNILGFVNVLDAAWQHRIERLVYASSADVYGEAGDRPLPEDAAAQPATPAGMEKLVSEGYAELYARQYGLCTLGLRYFSVYGLRRDMASSRAGVLAHWLDRIGRHRPVVIEGDGAQTRDFIHVDDAAEATVAALLSRIGGVCNVASGHRLELRTLAPLIGVALDARPLVHHVAARPGAIRHSWADVTRLREQLGFTPSRGFKTSLFELAADWQERHRAAEPAPARPLHLSRARARPHAGRALS